MDFDPAVFPTASVADTCSVWSMLSSQLLSRAIVQAQLYVCITPVVLYECLHKPRTITSEQQELMGRLKKAQSDGRFSIQECSLEDLLAVSAQAPGRLGAGELSCIATSYSIRSIAFITEEQLAKKYAKRLNIRVESTPRLYGYLHFHRYLTDADHPDVISEHEKFERRPLTNFLEKTYYEALRCRLMSQQSTDIKPNHSASSSDRSA
ncbi:hypothetical protein [Hahella sp. NBU794]|uniref:hypothetical protein n=1 Tax=Hahella sp. NBU794 TaxID=3422590 RepID=UPI003D6F8DB0